MTVAATTIAAVADRQFGARANAYVTSAVHASGWDLERIAAILRDEAPGTALDLGCGGGHVAYGAAAFCGSVVACDLSAAMLRAVEAEAARRGIANIGTVQARAEALPLADGAFDAVLTRFSAHHWENAAAGLREARRVLKAGGLFVAVDAVSPGAPLLDTHLQAVEALRDPSHVRDYSAAEWLAMLADAGFAVGRAERRFLRLDFADWTGRMQTPDAATTAIRYLQDALPEAARTAMGIEPDGSFLLPTLLVEARAA